MAQLAGLVVFHGVLLTTGYAFLVAIGAVRFSLSDGVRAAGLAHLSGVALCGLAVIALLTAGVSLGESMVIAIAVAIVAVCLLVTRLRHAGGSTAALTDTGSGASIASPRAGRDDQAGRPWLAAARSRDWPGTVVGAAIAAFLVLQVVGARGLPTAWDAAHNWTLKAVALAVHGHLDSPIFKDAGVLPGAHQEYPILHPLLGALSFSFGEETAQGLFVAEGWILVGAFVAGVAYLLRGRAPSSAFVLAPLGILLTSGVMNGIIRADADVTMAVFMAPGVLAVALWLREGRGDLLALAVLFLAAAANTKNEGLLFATLAIVIAAVLTLARRWSSRRQALVALVAFVAAVMPWRLWVTAHGPFPSDVAAAGSITPALLVEKLPQLHLGSRSLLERLLEGPTASLIVPAFIVIAVALLIAGGHHRTVGYMLGVMAVLLAAVTWVYWTSPQPEVGGHIDRTSIRTITAPIFIAATGLAYALSVVRFPKLQAERDVAEQSAPAAVPASVS